MTPKQIDAVARDVIAAVSNPLPETDRIITLAAECSWSSEINQRIREIKRDEPEWVAKLNEKVRDLSRLA